MAGIQNPDVGHIGGRLLSIFQLVDLSAKWIDSETLEIAYRWESDHPDHKTKNRTTLPKKGKAKINYVVEESD